MVSQSSADTSFEPTDLANGKSCNKSIFTYGQPHINFHPLVVQSQNGDTYHGGTLHQSEAHRVLRVDLDRLETLVLVCSRAVRMRER